MVVIALGAILLALASSVKAGNTLAPNDSSSKDMRVRTDIFIHQLDVGDWNDRIAAVHSLGYMGIAAEPGLAVAVEDADWQVRMAAVHDIGNSLGPKGVRLLKYVLKKEPCPVVRLVALHWLGDSEPAAEETNDIDWVYGATNDEVNACQSHFLPGRLPWAKHQIQEPEVTAASQPSQPAVPLPTVPKEQRYAEVQAALSDTWQDPPPSVDPPGRGAPEDLGQPPSISPRLDAAPVGGTSVTAPWRPGVDMVMSDDNYGAKEKLGLPPLIFPRAGQEISGDISIHAPDRPGIAAAMPEENNLGAPQQFGPPPVAQGGGAITENVAPIKAPSRPGVNAALPGTNPLGQQENLGPGNTPAINENKPVKAPPALMNDAGSKLIYNPMPALMAALKDKNGETRARAADELGSMGQAAAKAAPALIKMLGDKSPYARSSAAMALGDMGPAAKGAVPKLIGTLKDKSIDVRYSAALALVRIGTPKAQKAVKRYIGKEAYDLIEQER